MVDQENEQTKILREILTWTKFAGMNQVKNVLESTLDTPGERIAYQISDGTLGTVKVGQISRAGGHDKVARLWKEWRRKGLGDTVSVQGGDRFKRTFDLEDFGIEVPEIVQSAKDEVSHREMPPASTVERKVLETKT